MNLHQGVSTLPESSNTRKPEADVYTCFFTQEQLIEYLKKNSENGDKCREFD